MVKLDTIKIFLHKGLRLILFFVGSFFKIKNNRILLNSFNGKQYSCNPKYIAEYLLKNNKKKYEIIYVINNNLIEVPKKVIKIKFFSFKHFYYYFSSKILISNIGAKTIFKKRKNQFRIETWHGGGAYKKTDLAIDNSSYRIYKEIIVGNDVNFYISSCKKFTQIMSEVQKVKKSKFIEYGMPRNDIFFDKIQKKIANRKIREKYCLKNFCKVILYAPTWRDDGRSLEVKDIYEVVRYLNKISKEKHILLCRAHHSGKLVNKFNEENIINVTDYPDMQELLCAADILITDYSSCMWDFSLMYKPCFIYATDIDQYKQERDFYTPMSEWPFPIATNTDELINNILNFNQKEYVQKVKQHHKDLGSFEDGHACERVCKLIEDIIDGKVKN